MIRTDHTPEELLAILWEADPDLVERFHGYYERNPDVYEEFAKLATDMKKTGRKKYGAWVLVQALRWHRDLQAVGDVFKINNDYIALYARLLVHDDPVFEGFFEMRRMKASDRRQSSEERYRTG